MALLIPQGVCIKSLNFKNGCFRASKVAQQVRTLVAKPDPSSIPGTHVVDIQS